jgi:NADH dehydrogenase [ubiquinone] 1 alpha subcomplex assembly factor 6
VRPTADSTDLASLCRTQDFGRYLMTLYAPPAARPALWTLLAFNAELARIPEQISEPLIAEIRLAWWREAVEGAYAGTPRKHPVVEALALHVAPAGIAAETLIGMIDARDETAFPATLTELEAYARATAGTLGRCMAQVCADDAPLDAAEAAGLAWMYAEVLRAAPHEIEPLAAALHAAALASADASRQRPFCAPLLMATLARARLANVDGVRLQLWLTWAAFTGRP